MTDDTRLVPVGPGSAGVNPSRVRNHNERAILSLLRDRGALSGSEAARLLGVSAQTASVILRELEDHALVRKSDPVKGKVGKPQMPYTLNPSGAYSLGLRLGRRNADLVLMDFCGSVVAQHSTSYRFPNPALIEAFLKRMLPKLSARIPGHADRIVGMGIAAPFELWNWLDALGAPKSEAKRWQDLDLEQEMSRISGLSVWLANDVNMACNAELVFGAGKNLSDFAYFYIGSFVGGGIVLNGQVYHGPKGNAGAFGSIPVRPVDMPEHQLIHAASLYTLERAIADARGTQVNLRTESTLFKSEAALCAAWTMQAARGLATAMTAVTSVLDVEHIILDGAFPPETRDALLRETTDALRDVDRQGLRAFRLGPGLLGRRAGALGAAYEPLLRAHFLEGSALR